MNFLGGYVLFGLFLLMSTSLGVAGPIATADRSSFARLNGLPVPMSGTVLAFGEQKIRWINELSSQFAYDESPQEFVLIDGETYESHIRAHVGLGASFDVAIDVPWLHQSGGFMDSFVEDWHNTFGLPNGGRDRFETNQVRYEVRVGDEQFDYRKGSEGLGDVGITLRYQGFSHASRALAWHSHIELPTGQQEDMTGSESVDVALGFDYDDYSLLKHWGVDLSASAGWLWFGESKLLTHIKRDHTWYASTTMTKTIGPVPVVFQLQGHGRMYESEAAPFAWPAIQLLLATEFSPAPSYTLQAGISEDIVTKSSPDFTVFLHVTKHYEH